MLLHLTRVQSYERLSENGEFKTEVVKNEMLVEQDTITRASENGSGTTSITIRYPYPGNPLGYEEACFSVQEPIKYIFSGNILDRANGKGLEE